MKRALLIAGGTVGGLGAVLSITPPHLGVAATSVSALATGTTTDVPQADASSATPVSSPSTTTTPETTSSPTTSTSASATATATKSSSATSTPRATKSTAKSVTTKKATSTPSATKSTSTKTTASTPSATASATQAPASQTPTPTPTKTTATPTPTPTPTPVASGVSGSFTGGTFDAAQNGRLWGAVTVTVTLKNGEISNISAVQNPSSRGYNAFSYLTPAVLTQKLSVKTVMSITPTSLVSQIRGYTGASYSSYAYWQSLQSALSKAGF